MLHFTRWKRYSHFGGVQEGTHSKDNIFMIDQISDTCSQICTGLERLVTCLDHGDIAIQFAVMHNCVRLRLEMHLESYIYSHGK